ncbi:MAG: hypothetical protein NUV59_02440 [Patescibacteria group bacterium]|nr:hypothetical protein [Patescibacteria group bacterium]
MLLCAAVEEEVTTMQMDAELTEDEFVQALLDLERGRAAFALYLCLVHGDKLPKEQFGGVFVEEVREIAQSLLRGRVQGGVTF